MYNTRINYNAVISIRGNWKYRILSMLYFSSKNILKGFRKFAIANEIETKSKSKWPVRSILLFFSFFSPYFNKSNRGLPKMASATVNAGTQVRTSRSSVGTITGSTNDLVRLQQGVPAWITFTSLYHSRYIRKRVRESYLLTIRSIFVLVDFLFYFIILSFRSHRSKYIYRAMYAYAWTCARIALFFSQSTNFSPIVRGKKICFHVITCLQKSDRCQTP